MTLITTSSVNIATAYSNQRKVARTSNGVLWAAFTDSGGVGLPLRYSTDNGATWSTTNAGWTFTYTEDYASGGASIFIDQDDYLHVIYKNAQNGYMYYRRGTPNTARTSWTWSTFYPVQSNTYSDYGDIVAHREGTGWKVHMVNSYNAGYGYTYYTRFAVSSAGSITTDVSPTIISNTGATQNAHTFPALDFNHTGDGKTVAGGTPHIYIAWSHGTTGVGWGIRFIKMTYSTGAWTTGAEREIDPNRYTLSNQYWINCLFDGTRVIIPGQLYDGTNTDVVLYERDAADTTTTTRVLSDNAANADRMTEGSATYDSAGNVYLVGRTDGTATVHYKKWTRATGTLGASTLIDNSNISSPRVSVKRGYSNYRIEFVYTDGTGSPYSVSFDRIVLNDVPVVTVTPADSAIVDPRFAQTISWTYSDADGDPQASFSATIKEASAAPSTWAGGTASKLGTISTYTVPISGIYTIEAIGAAGGQSSDSRDGGKGARVVGDFTLAAGEVLNIIAGKAGGKPTESSRGGGGGGASWVYKTGAAQPMIAAGGGGGAGNNPYDASVQDASITTSGLTGTVTGAGAGGSGGNGGGAGTYAAGGAGWLTNGTNGYSPITGGARPANGAAGGVGYSATNADGGFGGGGGAYAGAGGGAGYSGGGAGGWSSSGHGGGGGSYNAGTNQILSGGIGTGEGSVTITQNGLVVFSTSGTTANSFVLPANSMTDEKTMTLTLNVSDGYNTVTKTQSIISQSWIYGSEIPSSAFSGNINAAGLISGEEYEIQVRTADAVGYGPWSSTVTTFITNVMVYVGGTWKASRKQFRHWSEGWKDQGTTKF